MTQKKKPTAKQVKDAIAVLAHNPIGNAADVLAAAGCTGYIVAGHTSAGNGFCLTNNTTRFVRGMVRKAMKEDCERERDAHQAAAAYESEREDAWFEQRNIPR